nr:hypothetical protein [Flavobacterium covae]
MVSWPKIEERYNAFPKSSYPTTSAVSTTTVEEESDLVPLEDKKNDIIK